MPKALAAGHGHQVLTFSRDGRLLMTVGTAGQTGTVARASDGTVVDVVADALDGVVAPLPSASR